MNDRWWCDGASKAGSFPEASSGEVTWVYARGKSWGTWCLSRGRYFWYTVAKSPAPSAALWSPKLLEAVRADFQGSWHPATGGFDAVLSATERATTIALCDKAGHAMARGRVCLIGDAAHAVTPWGGQGANLALEDAASLANQLLEANGDVTRALKAFDEERRPRSKKVAEFSKMTGDMQMSEAWWGPLMRRAMLNAPAWLTPHAIGWIYGHQPALKA